MGHSSKKKSVDLVNVSLSALDIRDATTHILIAQH